MKRRIFQSMQWAMRSKAHQFTFGKFRRTTFITSMKLSKFSWTWSNTKINSTTWFLACSNGNVLAISKGKCGNWLIVFPQIEQPLQRSKSVSHSQNKIGSNSWCPITWNNCCILLKSSSICLEIQTGWATL